MHDDRLDPATAGFVNDLRTTFADAAPPQVGAALQTVFESVTTPTRQPVATAARPTPRSRFMFMEVFKSLPSKITAGVFGAAIAIGGLGAAGALPGSMVLTSNEKKAEVTETEGVEVEGAETEGAEVEGGEVDGEESGPSENASPVATAAQNHEFDEACGNHGAYVSHFARTGEEPECATGESGTELESSDAEDDAEVSPRDNAKNGDAGKARAAAAKAKGGRP